MIQTKLMILILFSICLMSPSTFAAGQCVNIFSTFKMTSQIQRSIDSSILGLADLKLDLDYKKVQGINTTELTALSFEYAKKEKELSIYLERHGIMTKSELVEKVKDKISDLQTRHLKKQRKNVKDRETEARRTEKSISQIKKSAIDGKKAVFHRVEPGTFLMSDHTRADVLTQVTLTRAFEMMATPTTQIIWEKIVKIALKKYGAQDPQMQLEANPSQNKGDLLPVEYIKYDEVKLWLEALNRLSRDGAPELNSIIVGHKAGDVYRLPTEAEWEFVARERGTLNDKYYLGNNPGLATDYIWSWENSNLSSQPVAQKLPLKIGSMEFYDMIGNVQVWTADAHEAFIKETLDPHIKGNDSSQRVVRGSAWHHELKDIKEMIRKIRDAHDLDTGIGFRIVREVKP